MGDEHALSAARMINPEGCPIDDLDSAAGATFAQTCRSRYLEDGTLHAARIPPAGGA